MPDGDTSPGAERRRRAPLLLLVTLTAAAPLALQIFLPALPAIQAAFGVEAGTAQLVLSLSILANAVATLAYGPLADRYGRRPVLLGGLAAFVLGSLVSTLAPTIGVLVIGRVVQSVGAAAGMVLARAIVRDLYDREEAARMIAYLIMAMVVAPMLAPAVGALLLDFIGWRAVFGLVLIFGLGLTLDTALRLDETRPADAPSGSFSQVFRGSHELIFDPRFAAYVLQSSFQLCVFYSFLAGAPYFMIQVLNRPATEYGIWFMIVSAGFMAGNFTAARTTQRVGLDRMILVGTVAALLFAVLALALLSAGLWHPLSLFGPMMGVAFANGLTVPNAQAGAISVRPLLAGTASGVAGFSQMFLAAIVSQIVGMLQDGTPYAMAISMALLAALSLLGFVLPRRSLPATA
ncbi:MAG: multidrug effflux MFS transporter [Geminicoccaceae bacterium]|nr:multidrug effflux MFS transporter [Geminicoccaceae bacterium]